MKTLDLQIACAVAFCLALLPGALPLAAETPEPDAHNILNMPWSELAAELEFEHLLRVTGSGAHGEYRLLGVAGRSSLRQTDSVEALRERLRTDGSPATRQAIVYYEPYTSDLLGIQTPPPNRGLPSDFAADAPQWIERPWDFDDYLHDRCYQKIDYKNDDVPAERRRSLACYLKYLELYAAGDALAYEVYLIWGLHIFDRNWDQPLVLLTLLITVLVLTLPLLGLYLGILYLLRHRLRQREMPQRLCKVLLPLALGVASAFCWALLKGNGWKLPGVLAFGQDWLIWSSFFYALSFVACMWIADRLIFPENGVMPLWLIVLAYILGPVLMMAGGAASSAASRGGSARGDADNAGRDSAGSSGGSPLRSGGGTFGGGGASGSF